MEIKKNIYSAFICDYWFSRNDFFKFTNAVLYGIAYWANTAFVIIDICEYNRRSSYRFLHAEQESVTCDYCCSRNVFLIFRIHSKWALNKGLIRFSLLSPYANTTVGPVVTFDVLIKNPYTSFTCTYWFSRNELLEVLEVNALYHRKE